MRADICDPADSEKLDRLRSTLAEMAAEPTGEFMAHGVYMVTLTVLGKTLSVFSDPWSIDVEGPDEVVTRLLQHLAQT